MRASEIFSDLFILEVKSDLLYGIQGTYQSKRENANKSAFTQAKHARETSLSCECNLRPRSHYSVFVMMRFCCMKATRSHYSVFVQKRREKHPLLCIYIDLPDNNTEPKISVFVRSHCSGFVKLIVGYSSVFKNLRFCAFTLIKCFFKNLRFCGYPLLITFSKTSVFVAFLCGSV